MNEVNRTLYIPLYGKAYVSGRGLFLKDKRAEEICAAEGVRPKGRSGSKWLAFYMGMRAAVFDGWVKRQLRDADGAAVLHIGCGLDSRAERVGNASCSWYDIDMEEVIRERRRHFKETESCRMISADIRDADWLESIPGRGKAIVVMEGVSMYLKREELRRLTEALGAHFDEVALLMDCYSERAARLSKYRNPVNDAGVFEVYGTDDPCSAEGGGLRFVGEHEMTPAELIAQLKGAEKYVFRMLYGGRPAKKLYKLCEYKK